MNAPIRVAPSTVWTAGSQLRSAADRTMVQARAIATGGAAGAGTGAAAAMQAMATAWAEEVAAVSLSTGSLGVAAEISAQLYSDGHDAVTRLLMRR
jgi:hypothetical protein